MNLRDALEAALRVNNARIVYDGKGQPANINNIVGSVESRLRRRVPPDLRGDGPCADCGSLDNIVWFTDNVVWNRVTGESIVAEEARGAILCIPCFVVRADRAGLHPTGWRLLPNWPWRLR